MLRKRSSVSTVHTADPTGDRVTERRTDSDVI
jgi:hypothetical protein